MEKARAEVLAHLDGAAKSIQIMLEVQDFSKFTDICEYQKRFAPIFESKDVAMVITTAGLGYPGPIDKLSAEEVGAIASVNLVHPTFLSRVALDYMAKRPEKSCLINVGSVMEKHPSAGFSMYTSTKAFVHFFASALAVELHHDRELNGKIEGLLYSPAFVSTKLNGLPFVPLVVPTPLQAARGALADCGFFSYTNGIFVHAIINEVHQLAAYYLSPVLHAIFHDVGLNDVNSRRIKEKMS